MILGLYTLLCLTAFSYHGPSFGKADLLQFDKLPFIEMLEDMNKAFLEVPNEVMWSDIPYVAPDYPFFFFHQRKSGGTVVRYELAEMARRSNLGVFIPCVNNVNCDTYKIPHGLSRTSIYGGHFKWGVQDEIARADFGNHNVTQFSCTTNFREPLDRVLSCFRYRFRVACLSEYSVEDLEQLLYKKDPFGQSCMNEPFRAMSGFAEEELLDHLYTFRPTQTQQQLQQQKKRRLDELDMLEIYKLTLQNTAKCAPMVLEFPQSEELVNDRFPLQLRKAEDGTLIPIFRPDKSVNDGTTNHANTTGACQIDPLQMEMLSKHIFLENMLYNTVVKKVKSKWV
jgi:hypothetical protein